MLSLSTLRALDLYCAALNTLPFHEQAADNGNARHTERDMDGGNKCLVIHEENRGQKLRVDSGPQTLRSSAENDVDDVGIYSRDFTGQSSSQAVCKHVLSH